MTNAVATKKENIETVTPEIILSDSELAVVKQSQSVMQTAYDDRVLVKMIASQIGLPDKSRYPNVAVTGADVLQICRLAASMHLDPVLGGVWGFKDRNGRLVCGVAKKGWQQALHSQPDFQGVSFKHGNLRQNKIPTVNGAQTITFYDFVTCVIKKSRPDGSIGEYEGTAFFDEEFDPSKPTWLQRPKRMLESRALTIAASNAYGWGAYDQEEAAAAVGYVQKKAPVIDKSELETQMKNATSRAELVDVFQGAPDELKADPEIIELGKELTKAFKEHE